MPDVKEIEMAINAQLKKILSAKREGERQAMANLPLKHRDSDDVDERNARKTAYDRHVYNSNQH